MQLHGNPALSVKKRLAALRACCRSRMDARRASGSAALPPEGRGRAGRSVLDPAPSADPHARAAGAGDRGAPSRIQTLLASGTPRVIAWMTSHMPRRAGVVALAGVAPPRVARRRRALTRATGRPD